MIDDYTTQNDFAGIYVVENGINVCVGAITSGNPSVEISLENHGHLVYRAFVGLNQALNTHTVGIVQVRIIGDIE
jgi:hypothetical protein